ncbi:MAG TPA: TonB-dependent receptor [Steroidobacteraceae bacterium]|jgi:outer membrane receptor protein involved in Fe transport|nr:TonB-dependent receptor [Steroidobacteraceae bacterium]
MKTAPKYRKMSFAAAIAATLAMSAGPRTAWAQTADATLRGKATADTDVVAKNIATGATRRTRSNADGSYTLPGLQPGTYTVEAGPGTQATVTLSVASTATLDLTAAATEAAPVAEVTVTAKRLVETRTSEVGTTVSLHQIETVPQITRNFLEFADTVPGLVFNVNDQGQTSLQSGGQNSNAVNVYIDGVGQKNYVKEGGVSGQFDTQGNPFPQLAIGEYKVITSNYKAEFDQVSSAAVTAGTKSGTNEFHGEFYGQYTSDKFRAETPSEHADAIKTPSNDKEFGAALGGPIIKDMLHFFVAYEGKRFNTPITVTPGVTTLNGLPINNFLPADVNAQFGPASLPFKEDLFFGKLDFEPSEYDRIEFSVKVRNEDQIENLGIAKAASADITTKNNDTRYTLRWAHSADRWLNEVLITHEDAFNQPSATNIGNGLQYNVFANNQQAVLATDAADPRATQDKGQRGPGIQDDLTFSDLHWLGDHTVKTGAKFKRIDLTAADAENINPQFYFNVTPAGTDALPYKALFTNPVPGLSPTATSRDNQFGIYLQDDWVQNEHLTWNLGMRWDYERNLGYLDYVTPAAVVAAYGAQDPAAPPGQTYAQSLAKGGINVNDYISTGNNRKAYTGEFQPRLGFSFDFNGDQQHVLFGGYGRSYDRDLYDYLQVEVTKAALPEYTVFFPNAAATAANGCLGTPCVAWDPKFLTGLPNLQALVGSSAAGAEIDAINNNLKVPYSDQFSVGIRNRVGDWNTSAAVARILSKDGFVFTLGNRTPTGAFFFNGGPDFGNGVPGFGSLIIGNNGIETKTTQILLSAEKPYTPESHWGATFAYTYTSSSANRDTTQHYSFDEPTIQQYPFINSNAAARHRIVGTGSYGAPWGFVVAGKLTLATPLPVDDVACIGLTYPSGATCVPRSVTPKNFFGYRSVDLQVTKNFDIANYASVYVRLDGLNIFDFHNYADTLLNFGTGGVANPNPIVYNYAGNIVGVPRTLKLSVGAKF